MSSLRTCPYKKSLKKNAPKKNAVLTVRKVRFFLIYSQKKWEQQYFQLLFSLALLKQITISEDMSPVFVQFDEKIVDNN